MASQQLGRITALTFTRVSHYFGTALYLLLNSDGHLCMVRGRSHDSSEEPLGPNVLTPPVTREVTLID